MTTKEYYKAQMEGIKETMKRTDLTDNKKWVLGATQERYEELKELYENEPEGIRI